MGEASVRVDPTLRFLLPPRLRGEVRVAAQLDGTSTLVHVLEALGIPRTEMGRVEVNGSEASLDRRPQPGDEVVVAAIERPQLGLPQRYLLDVHLGTLARRMRLLGLDTAYPAPARRPGHAGSTGRASIGGGFAEDRTLVDLAVTEGRVLLTRDRGLLRRRGLPAGALVRGDDPDEQLADVLDRFAPDLAPWTRCPACNATLRETSLPEVAHLLEPGTLQTYTQFARCTGCGRPYWRGAHAAHLESIVAQATGRGVSSTSDRHSEKRPLGPDANPRNEHK